MSDDAIRELLAALERANAERAARVRRGWYLLAAALACLAGFVASTLLGWHLGFPSWLIAAAAMCELGAFVCLWCWGHR